MFDTQEDREEEVSQIKFDKKRTLKLRVKVNKKYKQNKYKVSLDNYTLYNNS